MIARLHVTPKTTEQNQIVCTNKSEAEVTNNKKKLCLRYSTIDAMKLTTDRHEALRSLFATAELLVTIYCHSPGGDAAAALSDMAFYMRYIQSPQATVQQPWRSLHSLSTI